MAGRIGVASSSELDDERHGFTERTVLWFNDLTAEDIMIPL